MLPFIALIGNAKFSNAILVQYIQEKLEIDCAQFTCQECESWLSSRQDQDHDFFLLLWDFHGNSDESLWDVLANKDWFDEATALALYNVESTLMIEHQLMEKGVKGVFYTDSNPQLFTKGIHSILDGEIWYSRKIMSEYFLGKAPEEAGHQAEQHQTVLTTREMEILQMITSGLTNTQIAKHLYISQSTVKTHVYNIFQKIGVSNRIQAAFWSLKFAANNEPSQQQHAHP